MSETIRSVGDQSIAIVGMAAVLPGAIHLAAFWANAVNGVTSVAKLSTRASSEDSEPRWAGLIPPLQFDSSQHELDASTVQTTPPAQLLAMEVGRRALAGAGYVDRAFDRARESVIFAAPPQLRYAVADYVSARLGLSESTADAMPDGASSLAAVEFACASLRAGTTDLVVCSAVDLLDGDLRAPLASPDSTTRTFEAEAVIAIVLKRLADAERDGDTIHVYISGMGCSDAGAGDALEHACTGVGVLPSSVGLIEAHGAAIADLEGAEIAALDSSLRRAGAGAGSVTLTSATSQVGDTGVAAGLVSLVRAALALHHHVLPSTPDLAVLGPALAPDSPLVLNTTAMPWPGSQHRAAVSDIASGGAARAVILEAYDGQAVESGLEQWPSELFLLRGETLDAAHKEVDALLHLLERGASVRLRDLSRSVAAGNGPVQIALVASSLDDLRAKLNSTRDPKPASGVFFARESRVPAGSKLAFLFPGQGSQRPGMLRDLFIAFPRLQQHLEAGSRWAGLILPPTPWTDAEKTAQRERLTDTRAAQPALGVTGMAMADLLLGLGIVPDALGGHSYGELVALCVAGVFSEADLMSLSEARARCIIEATETVGDPGSMAAVSAGRDAVAQLIEPFEGVVIANENSPEQTVISGLTPAVQAAVASIKEKGLAAVQLQVACAFHSPVVAAGSVSFREHLDRVAMALPRLRVFSNTTAEPYPEGADSVRARLAEHIARSVQFVREVEAMYDEGVRIFVEVGPGRVLTGLVGKTLGSRPHLALNTDHTTTNGVTQLLNVLAQLAVTGVEFDVEPLFAGRDATSFDLTVPPEAPEATLWVDARGVRSGAVAADPDSVA